MVWGKLQGFDWWPTFVVHDREAKQEKIDAERSRVDSLASETSNIRE